MPYIKQGDRDKFTIEYVDLLRSVSDLIDNCGELNYVFTVISQKYLNNKGLKYQNINDIIGALEGAKLELYRKVASPYEDEKIEENGDVNELS